MGALNQESDLTKSPIFPSWFETPHSLCALRGLCLNLLFSFLFGWQSVYSSVSSVVA